METRTCKKCGVEQDIENFDFFYNKNSKGRRYTCKVCRGKIQKEAVKRNPVKYNLSRQKLDEYYRNRNDFKIDKYIKKCNICGIPKESNEFVPRITTKSGVGAYCIKCESARNCWRGAKRNDERKGYNTCSLQEWLLATNFSCLYCKYDGLVSADRINNNIGHELTNIIPCCKECNLARGDSFTTSEMIEFIGPAIKLAKESRKTIQVIEEK